MKSSNTSRESFLNIILRDPLTWINIDHIGIQHENIEPYTASLINELMIRKMGFTVDAPLPPNGSLAWLFIDNWFILPKVSFLMFCQRYRGLLSYSAGMNRLPEWVRQFALSNIVAPSNNFELTKSVNPAGYIHNSQSELLYFKDMIPSFISERVPYLYTKEYNVDKLHIEKPSITLLRMAIQHVRKNEDKKIYSSQ